MTTVFELDPTDLHFAEFIRREAGDAPDWFGLAVSLASNAVANGNICLNLADISGRVVMVDLGLPLPVTETHPLHNRVKQRVSMSPGTVGRSTQDAAFRNNPPPADFSGLMPPHAGGGHSAAASKAQQTDNPVRPTFPGRDNAAASQSLDTRRSTGMSVKSVSLQQHSGSRAASGNGEDEESGYLSRIRCMLEKIKDYPPEARRAGMEGTVLVRFTLNRDGMVGAAEISGSSGTSLLDQAALHFITIAARFPPFPESFSRQMMTLEVPIIYKLADARSM